MSLSLVLGGSEKVASNRGQWACLFSFPLSVLFLFNCKPLIASSRFDSGVSILVAAFVRPDGWIQKALVPERTSMEHVVKGSRPNEVLYCTVPYCTVLYGGGHLSRAMRHGSSCVSCSGGFGHVTLFGEKWRMWLEGSYTR